MLFDEVSKLVDELLPELVQTRRDLHRSPEIALHEHKAAALVRNALADTALRLLPPFLGTDVVGLLDGRHPGKNFTLRADLDALPLQENGNPPYKSEVPGMCHACGHDGHTAMLLGAALVLDKLRHKFMGSVRFVFQPGEEVVAAGKELVAKGALLDPTPDGVLALHGAPGLPVGMISSRPGDFHAAADFFKITIVGKGAHGSMPHESVDPISVGCLLVQALQAIPARRLDALKPAVLSVCRFSSGGSGNVIPDTALLEGTTRYYQPELGGVFKRMIEQCVQGVCLTMGASYQFEYLSPYAPTINTPEMVAFGKDVVQRHLGAAKWRDMPEPSMGAEDFAYFLQDHPGAMFLLGLGENAPPLHNPCFDFNDAALRDGVLFLVMSALDFLNQ